MPSTDGDVNLAGIPLGQHGHVCAFFHSRDEEYQVLLPFIQEGMERGDRAFHIVDERLRDDHLRRLREARIDAKAACERGQLTIRAWEDAYLRDGHFDQFAMVALLEQVLQSGRAQGYQQTRVVGHMEWALEDRPGVRDIIEYETRLNTVLSRYDDLVICAYDCARFGADVVMDALRTHPAVIIGGVLHHNPFFVPPEEFLAELRGRSSAV